MKHLVTMILSITMLIISFGNTFAESNSNSGTTLDGIERKYASTRMTGCDENDIILGDKVWASCNSSYYLDYSKIYKNTDEISTDINGWKLGRLYSFSNQACPAGYKIPTKDDFFGLNQHDYGTTIIKLPYAGYGYYGGASTISYSGKDSYTHYWTDSNSDETSKGWIAMISSESNRLVSVQTLAYTELNKYFMPLRCIRSTKATFEEINGDLKVADNGLTMTGGMYQTTFGSGYNNSYTYLTKADEYNSKDQYVNEKLKEINDCFLSNYNAHLENINRALEKLKKEKEKQKDEKSKKKYDNAIKKLEEIKILFIKRYKNVIDFDGIN